MEFLCSCFGLVFIVCFLPFLFLLLLLKDKNNPQKLPPSPPKLPIIGNLHQLGKFPFRSLSQLSKKYGPAMLLQLGNVPTLVISSAKTAREVLKTHDLDCCSRPTLAGPKRLSYNFLDVAFSPYGQYWREMRKSCALELFSTKRVQSFRFVREEEVTHLINSISQASSPSPVHLTEKLFSLTDRIVCRTAFGKSYFGRGFDNGRFHEVVTEAMVLLRSFSAEDHFPYVGWIVDLLSGFHARVEKNFLQLDAFYEWVINDHLDTKRLKPDREDIIDLLLGLQRGEGSGAVCLTKDHIKAVLMNIFLAGVETTGVTMVWAMAELAKNPRIMSKLQEEIRHYVGSKGKVEESDLNQLVYLKMVVKETLRLHPPGTFLLPRETIHHCKINGYNINPKTRIEVNIWAINRDPKYWECPEEFWPERFMGNSIDFNGTHFEFLTFGSGRRGCPGMNMGTVTVELAIANLLYHFNWELPGGLENGDINMEESAGVAVHKKTDLYLVPINHSWSP